MSLQTLGWSSTAPIGAVERGPTGIKLAELRFLASSSSNGVISAAIPPGWLTVRCLRDEDFLRGAIGMGVALREVQVYISRA